MLRIKGQSGVWVKAVALALSTALLFGAASQSLAQERDSFIPSSQSLIARTFNSVWDWTVQAWQSITNWIIEQSTHLARAFNFWSEEPIAQDPTPEPQVLGEETSQQLSSSPLTYKTELVALAKTASTSVKPVLTPPSAPTETTLPSEPTLPEPPLPLLGKEGIPSEPAPAPTETSPTQPEIVPTPESTPEALPSPQPEETKTQSSSYYIPILARDTIPPASSVSALATTTASNIFTVSWTGEDTDVTGSPAVASFDIQYQVDSGDWTDWLLETVLLSSTFTTPLSIEKTYGFRSRARDRYSNLENYPDSADASIYVNLLIPVNPSVTSHSSGATLLSTAADEDSTSGSTVQVTLSGDGEADGILTIFLAETATTATTTIDNAGHWSKQFTLAEGVNNFTLQSQEADGDNSNSVLFLLNLEMVPTHDVVINEIAWMGTALSGADEWIELYNASSTAIDLTGWTLTAATTGPTITLSGSVAAKSYFLLEHTDNNTVFDITADQIYGGGTSNQMSNAGELLMLRKTNGQLIDKVGSSTAAWFAGNNSSDVNRASMERKDPTGDGTLASNWATNDGALINGQDNGANNIKGTPRSLNSQNTTIPRVVTNLQQQWIYTTTTSVKLYWSAPNLATTTPATYDIRYSTGGGCPITENNWSDVGTTQATGEPVPSTTEGTAQTATVTGLTQNTSYCFAMKTSNSNETSGLSNIFNGNTYDSGFTTLGFGGDTVSSNTTIATSTKPYLVNRNFSIAAGVTLTINPGVVIKMNTSGSQRGCNADALSCAIIVAGSLILGSASDAINAVVITTSEDDTYAGDANGDGASTGTAGDWDKIATNGAASSVTAYHSIIRYGGYGGAMVQMTAGSTSLDNSIVELSSGFALTLINNATALSMATSTVQNNAEGIGISNQADATIQGSTFTGNHRGIAINSSADESHLIIRNNNFFANNTVAGGTPFAGIHYSDTTGILVAENNWWGSASGPTTISPDGDATRDAAMADTTAVIDYDPYATSAFSILPSGL